MTRFGSSLALAVLIGWVLQWPLSMALSPLVAVGLAGAVGGAVAFAFSRTIVVGGAVALLAPFGVMLPGLAFGSMIGRVGVDLPVFSALELAVFLVAYTVFLLSAFGVVRTDIYRFGYAPVPVGLMVVALCLYAAVTGHWVLALIAVAGQLFWIMKWGSSNWFDYVLHVVLWPAAIVAFVARLFEYF